MLDGCHNMVQQTTNYERIILCMQQYCNLTTLPYRKLSLQILSLIEPSVLHLHIVHATSLS